MTHLVESELPDVLTQYEYPLPTDNRMLIVNTFATIQRNTRIIHQFTVQKFLQRHFGGGGGNNSIGGRGSKW